MTTDMTVETPIQPETMVSKKRMCYREWQFYFSALTCFFVFYAFESPAVTFFCWIATSNLFDQTIFRFMKCKPSNRIKALKPGVSLEDFDKYTHYVVKTKSIVFCISLLLAAGFITIAKYKNIPNYMHLFNLAYVPSFYLSIWISRARKKIKYPYIQGTETIQEPVKFDNIYHRHENNIVTREFLLGY